MDKQKQMYIGGAVVVVAVAAYLYSQKLKKDKGVSVGGDTTTGADTTAAAVNKLVGKYGVGKITSSDLAYYTRSGNTGKLASDWKGVDYNDSKNTEAANTKYLSDNPDITKTTWDDAAADGTIIGWSHYVMYGNGEGRKWGVPAASFAGNFGNYAGSSFFKSEKQPNYTI